MTLAHTYSLVGGVAYLTLGVVGFLRTGVSGGTDMMNDMLFGAFMINPFHNVVDLTVGVLWLLGAFVLTAGKRHLLRREDEPDCCGGQGDHRRHERVLGANRGLGREQPDRSIVRADGRDQVPAHDRGHLD
jgi:Domain of unknown function (DUF4383)